MAVKLTEIIHELNFAQTLEKKIFEVLSVFLNSNKNKINHNELYHHNQQIFYSSLRCYYGLDEIISRESYWSLRKISYFNKLQSYLRELLNTSKLLPPLTYILWQQSLKKYSEYDLNLQLNTLFPSYAEAHFQTNELFRKIKNND